PRTELFSFLTSVLLLLPRPLLFYSLKNCTIDFYDQNKIVCDFNKLTSIPAGIPKSATSLSFFYNKIERIRQTDLTGFTRLTFLHLGFNRISHIDDGAFTDLSAVTDLMLGFNKLTALRDETFKGLNNLTTLYLNVNQIISISKFAFEPLKELQILYMESNNLFQMSDIVNIVLHCPDLKNISLNHNNLTSFESDLFPVPLLNLMKLDLDSNPLKKFSVHPNVFPNLETLKLLGEGSDFDYSVSDGALTSVRSLTLYETKLPLPTYKLIFQSVDSLENLYLSDSHLESDKGLLEMACEIPTLQKLDSGDYFIPILNESILQSCTNLTELHLQSNSMSDLTESSLQMLTRLTRLTIHQNQLSRIPLTIRNMSTLTFLSISKLETCVFQDLRNLKVLEIQENVLTTLSDTFGSTLKHLVTLKADGNNFRWFQRGTFQNLPALRELNVKSVREIIVEDGAFMGLKEIKSLTYSPSNYDIGSFTSLQQLEKLAMFLTYPACIKEQTNKELSVNLPSLQELSLVIEKSACFSWTHSLLKGLSNLKTLTFENYCCRDFDEDKFIYLPQLINLHFINCDHSGLDKQSCRIFGFLVEANLTKLEMLILKDNVLTVINETIFKALPSLKYLDLSGNPFVCNCSNTGFIEWAIRNKQVQVANAFQYRCSSPSSEEGNFLLDFNVRWCWEFTGFLCFISSSALVLLTLLSSFIFHFLRWQLVYGYYLLLAFLYDSKKRRQDCPHIYDAFVSYNVHDEDWGWKLCLHHRDFIPGTAIIENITDAIYSSRRTLCVISHRYLQSEWCSQEIQLLPFVDEHKDVLILLFLEEISSNQLSPFYRMRKLVKSRTYLSWTQARSHKGLFWEKVRRALECGHEPGDNHNPLTADA
uniref:TIR domain-containing protein n=1 Tax=Neogobius melanostomus TaxID=47308 RepID=A0A8C6WSX6_9GOBI